MTLKLSDNTTKILANFATINPSLYFTKGNVLKTVSPNKTILAVAEVEENFEQEFGIYNLSRLLSVLSLLKEPEIDLHEKFAVLRSGKRFCNYTYTDKTMIVTPPPKDINFKNATVEFTLTAENLQSLMKAVAVLGVPEVLVVGDGEHIVVRATDSKNPTADHFDVEVGETGQTFKVILKAENMKLLGGDYTVSLAAGIVRFVTKGVTYFLASEVGSSVGG